jgi:hypothetical protein
MHFKKLNRKSKQIRTKLKILKIIKTNKIIKNYKLIYKIIISLPNLPILKEAMASLLIELFKK